MNIVLQPFRKSLSSRRFCSLLAFSVLSSTPSKTAAWVDSNRPFRRTTLSSTKAYSKSTSFSTMRSDPSTLSVAQFPCLSDNYGYLIHDPLSGSTAAIDVPCARSYQDELDRRGWKLTHVLNTHHHRDHTGGNLELKKSGVTIIGPKNEQEKIPGIDVAVGEDDVVDFGGSKVIVMDAGGHTKGHISYYFPDQSKIFVGDCIFSLGCGKMFEGTPEQFWGSLLKHRALPDETMIYW